MDDYGTSNSSLRFPKLPALDRTSISQSFDDAITSAIDIRLWHPSALPTYASVQTMGGIYDSLVFLSTEGAILPGKLQYGE